MSTCEYITLRGGQVISVPVLRRIWDIEARGVRFECEGDEVIVGPRRLLEDGDLTFLREHKAMLMSILSGEVTV